MSKLSNQRKIVIQNGSKYIFELQRMWLLMMWNGRIRRAIGKVHRADRMMMRSGKLRLGQLQESLLLSEGSNHTAAEKFCLTAWNPTIQEATNYGRLYT